MNVSELDDVDGDVVSGTSSSSSSSSSVFIIFFILAETEAYACV